jgi:hypothetical protein
MPGTFNRGAVHAHTAHMHTFIRRCAVRAECAFMHSSHKVHNVRNVQFVQDVQKQR